MKHEGMFFSNNGACYSPSHHQRPQSKPQTRDDQVSSAVGHDHELICKLHKLFFHKRGEAESESYPKI
jgi:hypothetical protein